DATNELTYMILEAEAHVHLPEPNLELRLHKNSPEKLILNALEVLRLGTGKPQIVNDDIIIPSLMSRGVSLKEARNYASVGCQENTTDPNMTPDGDTWARTNAGWYNLAKPVEYALYSGVNPIYNKQIGPKTPDPCTFRSIDDMIDAVQRQDDYFARLNADMNNIYDYILSQK
ncbi:MAG: glycyl radical protein, partial [Candidatus Aenigmarchaeota archaeon]|nr:glycyl radical protein [Candidatus Aenigmarchaeota archaeon]